MKLTDQITKEDLYKVYNRTAEFINANNKLISKVIFGIFVICLFVSDCENQIGGWGLDASWVYLVNVAKSKDIVFGQDVFFTYGPLGYILYPMKYGSNLLISVMFQCVLIVISTIALYILIGNPKFSVYKMIVLLGIGCIVRVGNVSSLLSFTILLLSMLILEDYHSYICMSIYSVIVAICFLIKFDITFEYGIVFSVTTLCICFDKFKKIGFGKEYLRIALRYLAILCSCPLLGFLFYLIYSHSLSGLIQYISTAFKIASGYSEAMSFKLVDINKLIVIPVILVIAVIISLVIFKFLNIYQVFVFVFFVLINVKYAMVRTDMFHVSFLSVANKLVFLVSGILICRVIDAKTNLRQSGVIVLYLIILSRFSNYIGMNVLLILFAILSLLEKLNEKWRFKIAKTVLLYLFCICMSFVLFTRISSIKKGVFYYKAEVEGKEFPSEISNIVQGREVSIYPWNLLWDDMIDIDLKCAPIFQAYAAFIPELDNMNADFYSNDASAPEYIIFENNTIDGRLLQWESPNAWQAICDNYEVEKMESNIYLLGRSAKKDFTASILGEFDANIVDEINVPQCDNRVRMYIDMELTPIGKIKRTFSSISPIFLVVEYKDDTRKVRVLTRQLSQGIPLYSQFYEEDYEIKSIHFTGDDIKYFNPNIHVKFEEIVYK